MPTLTITVFLSPNKKFNSSRTPLAPAAERETQAHPCTRRSHQP